MKTKILLSISLLILLFLSNEKTYAQAWAQGGNNLASDKNLGSLNNFSMMFITNGTERARFENTGAFKIGNVATGNYAQFSTSGNLKLFGSAKFLVGDNKYAWQAESDNDLGLFNNTSNSWYEFRNSSGNDICHITQTGDLHLNGALRLGSVESLIDGGSNVITSNSHLYPDANNTWDLGSSSLTWNDLFLGGKIAVNGTADVSLATDGMLTLGATTSANVTIDANEMQARSNGAASTLYFNFEGGDVNVGNSAIYVDDPADFVGIGTGSPTSRLYVSGTTTSTAPVLTVDGNYTSSSVDVRGIDAASVAAPGYGYGVDAEGGYIGSYGYANASTYTGGGFGVYGYANGSAGTRYGVYGYAYGGTTNYGVYASGDMAYTGSLYDVSDIKFKKDVKYGESMLDKIMSLRPATYSMKTEEFGRMNLAKGVRHGFIAQELVEVFPELVADNVFPEQRDEQGNITEKEIHYKGVNYVGMIPILTRALQEQQEQIKSKDQQITDMQDKLTDLENRLAALEQKASVSPSGSKAAKSDETSLLEQNVPNPFSDNTVIRYQMPEGSVGLIQVTDSRGMNVKSIRTDNSGEAVIGGFELPAGSYTYSLIVNGHVVDSKKMTLVR